MLIETDVYDVASDDYVTEVLPCSSDSRLPLTPTVSEDEFHEAWRRGGEEYLQRNLEILEAEIIAGGR